MVRLGSRLCPFYSPLFIFFHHVSALPSPPMQPLHVLLPLLLRSTIFRFQISNFKFKFKSTGYVGRFQSMLILSCCRAILTPGYQTVCNSFRFHTNVSRFLLIISFVAFPEKIRVTSFLCIPIACFAT